MHDISMTIAILTHCHGGEYRAGANLFVHVYVKQRSCTYSLSLDDKKELH